MNDFCSKFTFSYVSTFSEACLQLYHSHDLTITINKLNYVICSWRSITSGLDNISPILVKHLSFSALDFILNIINIIFTTNHVSLTWKSYDVILIPKPNFNTSFRPITLSATLRKTFKL